VAVFFRVEWSTSWSGTGPHITQLRVAVGVLEVAKQKLNQFTPPNTDRAYEFTDAAFDLIGLMRTQDGATEHATNVTKTIQEVTGLTVSAAYGKQT
jgi:hypothetical protein